MQFCSSLCVEFVNVQSWIIILLEGTSLRICTAVKRRLHDETTRRAVQRTCLLSHETEEKELGEHSSLIYDNASHYALHLLLSMYALLRRLLAGAGSYLISEDVREERGENAE